MTLRHLLLGPPGTGKTQRLLSEMDARLRAGVHPERVAFVSFTRIAIGEARARACDKFNFVDEQLPYFRTLHSLCYRMLGTQRHDMVSGKQLQRLAEITGETVEGAYDPSRKSADVYMFLDHYARNKFITLEQAFGDHMRFDITMTKLDWFVRTYRRFLSDHNQIDFGALLEQYVLRGSPVDVDVVFIDEAQDLTPLQWKVIEKAFSHVPEMFVAGDDDQAIFTWAGAEVGALLEWQGTREVLTQSYRLPVSVFDTAREVTDRMTRRNPKTWFPRVGCPNCGHSVFVNRGPSSFHCKSCACLFTDPTPYIGNVHWIRQLAEIDEALSEGTWLLLGRTRREVRRLEEFVRLQGYVYRIMKASSVLQEHIQWIYEHEEERRHDPSMPIWHKVDSDIPARDRDYYVAMRRRGENITKLPRIRIDTVHGAKGAEADNVVMMRDISKSIAVNMNYNPDPELRVLYVGVTRAKERLYMVSGAGKYEYQFN